MITTQNAEYVSEYLTTLLLDNAKYIPVSQGISRMGYADGELTEFVPYSENFEYIGDVNYKKLYNSVKRNGSLDEWIKIYKSIDTGTGEPYSIPAKISVLASFASVLIAHVKSLLYVFHLWGVSDIGKTVCLRLAASVWGEPDIYVQNMNATNVGLERTAHFLCNLPLILDELQTIRDENLSKLIYLVSQGQGRTRGSAEGVQNTPDWHNTVITTGEQPLTSEKSAGGEFNRVFDVYCDKKIFSNPEEIYSVTSKNYGWAGFAFILAIVGGYGEVLEMLTNNRVDLSFADLKQKFEKWQLYIKNAEKENTGGKKRMCTALLLLADELVNIIFLGLPENEAQNKSCEFFGLLTKYIEPKNDTDVVRRAYDYILTWIAENKCKFAQKTAAPSDNEIASNVINAIASEIRMPEVWGKFETKDSVFISGKILKDILDEGGYSYELTINEFNKRGWTVMAENQDKATKRLRLSGIAVCGVEIKTEL